MGFKSGQKYSGPNQMSTRELHWFFVLQESYSLKFQCKIHRGWSLSHVAWWYFCRDQRCLRLASEFILPSWVTLERLNRSIELHYFDIAQQTLRSCLEYLQVLHTVMFGNKRLILSGLFAKTLLPVQWYCFWQSLEVDPSILDGPNSVDISYPDAKVAVCSFP